MTTDSNLHGLGLLTFINFCILKYSPVEAECLFVVKDGSWERKESDEFRTQMGESKAIQDLHADTISRPHKSSRVYSKDTAALPSGLFNLDIYFRIISLILEVNLTLPFISRFCQFWEKWPDFWRGRNVMCGRARRNPGNSCVTWSYKRKKTYFAWKKKHNTSAERNLRWSQGVGSKGRSAFQLLVYN